MHEGSQGAPGYQPGLTIIDPARARLFWNLPHAVVPTSAGQGPLAAAFFPPEASCIGLTEWRENLPMPPPNSSPGVLGSWAPQSSLHGPAPLCSLRAFPLSVSSEDTVTEEEPPHIPMASSSDPEPDGI